MRRFLTLLAISCFGGSMIGGCGSSEPERADFPSRPREVQYAEAVRERVIHLSNPDQGDSLANLNIDGFSEFMSSYQNEEMGENEEIYKKINELTIELKQLCDTKGSVADKRAKIDEMTALTEKLPKDESKGAGDSGGTPNGT